MELVIVKIISLGLIPIYVGNGKCFPPILGINLSFTGQSSSLGRGNTSYLLNGEMDDPISFRHLKDLYLI